MSFRALMGKLTLQIDNEKQLQNKFSQFSDMAAHTEQIDLHFDMETDDPDDFFTLCFLASHPRVNLRSVTTTPGSRDQVGVVKYALREQLKLNIPVGAPKPKGNSKQAVSKFHYNFLGPIPPADPDGDAVTVMTNTFTSYPNCVLLTGAPLHNLGELLKTEKNLIITKWVAQGGFAGDSVVASEHRLKKFEGKETCATWNFGGNPEAALSALSSPNILLRHLISKNVCHGIVYDMSLHEKVKPHCDATLGLSLIYRGMEKYLKKKPGGKMFHDPLAACVAVNPDIVQLSEVAMYRQQGEWGSKLQAGTNTFISVAVNKDLFIQTLTEHD